MAARLAFERWERSTGDVETSKREAIRKAIDDCRDCDEFGRRDDLTRCDKHPTFIDSRTAHA
jgi:hypothetical protein